MLNNKKIAVLGGGTNTYISNHLALSAPAYGTTAKTLANKFRRHEENKMEVDLYLTKMASSDSIHLGRNLPDTPEEIEELVDKLIADPATRVIIFNVAMVDFKPKLLKEIDFTFEPYHYVTEYESFGKYVRRFSTTKTELILHLSPYQKVIQKIRKERKDILLVGFKTTCGATKEEQFQKGLKLCKDASANIVFVYDVDKDRIRNLDSALESKKILSNIKSTSEMETAYIHEGIKEAEEQIEAFQNNGLVTPEESSYWYDTRNEALDGLVQMVLNRVKGEFVRTTVVEGNVISWNDTIIPQTFKDVFNHIRSNGGWHVNPKGKTSGHFGIKINQNESICSIRKQNYNDIENVGMVKVITDDPDNVFGHKHFFRPDFGEDYQNYLEFIEHVLKRFDEQELIDDWLGIYGEYWDLLKIFPNFNFHTHEAYRQAKIRLEGNVYPDKIIAFGAKPSVGDATQRELFKRYPRYDCIIHFHSSLKIASRSIINVANQFNFECGSTGNNDSCAYNTTTNMKEYILDDGSRIHAVHLDHHGPNIMFSSKTSPNFINEFINEHWNIDKQTTGILEDAK